MTTINRTSNAGIDPGSFRDPSGFVFFSGQKPYRQINQAYRKHYDAFLASGLCEKLVKKNLLIPHSTAEVASPDPASCYKIIAPETIPFVSYPYEWCFSQLKDAALTTLMIQKEALSHKMTLKDASAYNIQFWRGCPVLVDTLSFEIYEPGAPWAAYRQFCQHFLAPLALMALTDNRLGQFSRIYIDGVPLDLTSSLLPFSSRFSFGLLTHLHLHAKSQKHYAGKGIGLPSRKLNQNALTALIDNLETTVRKLAPLKRPSEWGAYYTDTNYTKVAEEDKERVVAAMLDEIKPRTVWDLGANNGRFSRLASRRGADTVAFDIDFSAVESNYAKMKSEKEINLLPLYLDLANPSPALGFAHEERKSLAKRGPVDAVMALALIHHLAIANNLPFSFIARFLSRLGRSLIIEFVPKDDSNAKRLLAARPDIFSGYTAENLEQEFSRYFNINSSKPIKNSRRVLYLMVKK